MKIEQKFRIETYIDGNWFFEEIGEMLKIRENRNDVIREKMDLKNSVLHYLRYELLKCYGHGQKKNDEK